MSTVDELLALQTQTRKSIERALPNFKKLGQAKMSQAVTRQRLTALNETFARSQELDAKINLLADAKRKESDPYFKNEQFLDCEDDYNEAADFMAEILASYDTTTSAPVPTANVSSFSDSTRASSRLPRINLPTFEGSFDKWESFRDRFTSMVNNDITLSNMERMHYLCSCVKGEASNALSHLAITDANFEVAWNILFSRYENKRQLITGHLQTLLQLPSIATETSRDLRNHRDQTNAAIQALRNLNRPVDQWDDVLVFLTAQKLDKSSQKAWELKLGDTVDYPKYRELDHFLETRIRALEAIVPVNVKDKTDAAKTKNKSLASHSASIANLSCPLCKTSHLLYQCATFLKQTPTQRAEFIKKARRCFNCLSMKHNLKECTSSRVCKTCNKKHHTLLHNDNRVNANDSEEAPVTVAISDNVESEIASHSMVNNASANLQVLLATARVKIHAPNRRILTTRALIDQGSAATLITESIVQYLRLKKVKQSVRITGIGDAQSVVNHAVHFTLTPSTCEGPAYSTTALILKSLTNYKPNRVTSIGKLKHLSGLPLADSDPMSRDPIDLIIGADLFGMILLEGVRRGSDHEPIVQRTTFGWIVSSPLSSQITAHTAIQVHHGTILDTLDTDIRRFWEVEEIPQTSHLSPDEIRCEEYFLTTHTRTPQGRYIVRLPFKSMPPIQIGESRFAALKSLQRMENQLKREPCKATEYREFLEEYSQLGHMAKIQSTDPQGDPPQRYFISHHAVFRDSSATTRLRVVFNASCRSTNGMSLNDHLLVGSKLQLDITTVLLRWRQYQYVYTADIAKMYRQILVDPRDSHYQCILWRPSPDHDVEEYRLLTVTYGTASAPYLALRVLRQLATDEGTHFPLAVPVLFSQIYVDDCVFGADDKVLARQTRDQLIALLERGGFRLRKWASNCQDLLSDIDPSDHGLACQSVLQEANHLKILGINWNPSHDAFQFQVSISRNPGWTKRAVLSTIAKLFDPLGWVAPVIITAKIFMQQLWLLKCQWDDEIPDNLLATLSFTASRFE